MVAVPTSNSYSAPPGATRVRAGRAAPGAPPVFSSVVETSTGVNAPINALGQTLILALHGSGNNMTGLTGTRVLNATLDPSQAYLGDTTFLWHEVKGGVILGNSCIRVWPWDHQPDNVALRRESYWMGWTDGPDVGQLRLYTERRLDALMERIAADPRYSSTKRVMEGASMGGWGTMTYGIRRAHMFPALYPVTCRWRYCEVAGRVRIPSWTVGITPSYAVGSAPMLVAEDGGYSAAVHMDHVAWVANAAHEIPWIGWTVGRQDGYMPFQDHVDAVAALRATGRGFAFAWNDGAHGTGPNAGVIVASYPYGTFELGKGYPVFSEHSLDQDPAVDLAGGINLNLSFRNVVETAGTWSCQVTSIAAACTVKVKPKSPIYLGNPAPQLVTIPAANTWVTVSF